MPSFASYTELVIAPPDDNVPTIPPTLKLELLTKLLIIFDKAFVILALPRPATPPIWAAPEVFPGEMLVAT